MTNHLIPTIKVDSKDSDPLSFRSRVTIRQRSSSIVIEHRQSFDLSVQKILYPRQFRRRNAVVFDCIQKSKKQKIVNAIPIIVQDLTSDVQSHSGHWVHHDKKCSCSLFCYCNQGGFCWSCCGSTTFDPECTSPKPHPTAKNAIKYTLEQN
jgi:hypothetical protein